MDTYDAKNVASNNMSVLGNDIVDRALITSNFY